MQRQADQQPGNLVRANIEGSRRRRWLVTGAVSLAGHVAALIALLATRVEAPEASGPPPMSVALVDLQPPAPPAPKTETAKSPPKPARPEVRRMPLHRAPVRAYANTLPVDPRPSNDPGPGLTDGQLAGAALADGGAPGGACEMARRLQGALRKDPLVRSELTDLTGRAIMVWNGDWVRNGSEDGKGLAAVREAILWEVGFAPKPCRSEAVHGLILLSLNQPHGSVRLAVGMSNWRWSDLLAPRAETSANAASPP